MKKILTAAVAVVVLGAPAGAAIAQQAESAKPTVAPGQVKNLTSGSGSTGTGAPTGTAVVNGQGAERHKGFGYGFDKRNVSPS